MDRERKRGFFLRGFFGSKHAVPGKRGVGGNGRSEEKKKRKKERKARRIPEKGGTYTATIHIPSICILNAFITTLVRPNEITPKEILELPTVLFSNVGGGFGSGQGSTGPVGE